MNPLSTIEYLSIGSPFITERKLCISSERMRSDNTRDSKYFKLVEMNLFEMVMNKLMYFMRIIYHIQITLFGSTKCGFAEENLNYYYCQTAKNVKQLDYRDILEHNVGKTDTGQKTIDKVDT